MASNKRHFAEEDDDPHSFSKKSKESESESESDASPSSLRVFLNPADCDLGIRSHFTIILATCFH